MSVVPVCALLLRSSREIKDSDRIDEGTPKGYTVGGGTSAQSGHPFRPSDPEQHAHRVLLTFCTFSQEVDHPWGYTRGIRKVENS